MNLFRKHFSEVQSLQDQLTELESNFESLRLEKEKLIEDNKNLTEELNELKSAKVTLEEKVEEVEEALEETIEEVKEIVEEKETIEQVASSKAIEILSSISQPTVDIVEDPAMENLEQDNTPLLDKLKTLSGKELNEFFTANKNAIFKALKR